MGGVASKSPIKAPISIHRAPPQNNRHLATDRCIRQLTSAARAVCRFERLFVLAKPKKVTQEQQDDEEEEEEEKQK